MRNTSATTSTKSSQRSRGQAKKGRTTRNISWRERKRANIRDVENLAIDDRSQSNQESELVG